jgi:hypothetical protein
MLGSLYTAELSLVRRGANARRFAVTKGMDMDFNEVMQTVLATEAEGEKTLVQTLKTAGLEDDAVQVAVAQYRLQHGFKDKVTKEAFAEVAKAAGYDAPKKAEPVKKSEPDRSTKPAGMPPEMEAVWKAQQTAIDKANERADKVEAELEAVRKSALRKDYVAKCEREFAHVPGMTAEQMADMLMQAHSVSKEFGESLEKQWAETAQVVKKSALLGSAGSRGQSQGGSAWDKMQGLAKELVQKSAGELSEAKALDTIMQQRPDLYQEYLGDNPAQLGNRGA